jgi:curved DNA-binding protein
MSVNYKDYYQILGVAKTATEKEIKSAYRKLAKQFHPDINPGAADKFKDINEAFEVLSDPSKRQRYDTFGSQYQSAGGFSGGGGGAVNMEDLFSMFGGAAGGARSGGGQTGFSDFFEAMFNGGMGGGGVNMGGPQQQQRRAQATQTQSPAPQEASLTVTLEELLAGTPKAISLNDNRIEVKLPKGAKAGTVIRVAGKGPHGQDVHVKLALAHHPVFKPDGHDVLTDVMVPVPTMVLGGDVKVPTLGGGHGTITIPEGTPTDKKLRIKGQGLPKADGHRGDLFAVLKPQIPAHPSAEDRVFYGHLANSL